MESEHLARKVLRSKGGIKRALEVKVVCDKTKR